MMARRFVSGALVLALPLLAGCGWFGGEEKPKVATRPETPVEARCTAEAEKAPAIATLQEQMNYSDPTNVDRVNRQIAEAKYKARQDCLVRAGVARGGGVEPVRRSGLFY